MANEPKTQTAPAKAPEAQAKKPLPMIKAPENRRLLLDQGVTKSANDHGTRQEAEEKLRSTAFHSRLPMLGSERNRIAREALTSLQSGLKSVPAEYDPEKSYRVKLKRTIRDGEAYLRPSDNVIITGAIAAAHADDIEAATEIPSVAE